VTPGLIWVLITGTTLLAGCLATFTWVNRRVRVGRPITRRQQVWCMALLLTNLLVFWYFCITLG